MRRGGAGFTLMEVMIAVVVVGMAITVISQGFAAGTKAAAVTERKTRAALLAGELVCMMETGQIDILTQTEGEFANSPDLPQGAVMDSEGFRWRCLLEDAGMADLYKATITIEWSDAIDGGVPRGFEFVRYFYKQSEDEESSAGTSTGN